MPRIPAAALAVVPRVPGRGRPEPPPELDPLEARIWREVVDALPGHWLAGAGGVILRRAVAQAAILERQEVRLRELRAKAQGSGEEATALATQHTMLAKNVAFLLDQLRATPKSQLRSRAAGAKAEQAPGEWRPWEIKGGRKAQTETK
jgi:hypothetical protein